MTVSEQVIVEVERNLARKAPKALPFAREIFLFANVRILRDPSKEEMQKHLDWINHAADVPILVATRQANVDSLVTLNKKYFLNEPEVSRRSGFRIGTPGDALAWVRETLSRDIQ